MPSALSAEIYTIPLGEGRYLLYAPLRRAAFIANVRAVNFLADLKTGLYDTSADPDGALVQFLRKLEILDAEPESQPLTLFQGEPEPTTVSLFLTTACNLRCFYCYASARDTPKKFMPFEVAKRGIDSVSGNASRKQTGRFEVAYHGGGEPTLNWRVMTESLAYARDKAAELGLEFSAGAATNGVMNDTQIDWVIANLHSVSLSCDGLPSVNDQHRLMLNG